MPSNILSADTLFPAYDRGANTQEYLEEVSDYLFLLKEQLGYSLHNLGVANFNAMQLDVLAETIRKPLYAQIEDTDGNVAMLSVTAAAITSRLDDFNGTATTIEQTAAGLSSAVVTLGGDMEDLELSMSTLSQTVDGISTTVTTVSGNYISRTSATQTSSAFALTVKASDGTTTVTTVDINGLTVYRGKIRIKNNSGDDVLYADENGNLLLTGTISAASIYGSMITTLALGASNNNDHIVLSGNELESYSQGSRHGLSATVGGFQNVAEASLYHYGSKLLEMTANAYSAYVYGYSTLVLRAMDGVWIEGQTQTNRIVVGNNSINLTGQVYINNTLLPY